MTDSPDAATSADPTPAVCVTSHQPPYDFAWCEAHDETFPLGGSCRFSGRQMWEVFAEEADEQRQRAVRAEHELAELAPLAGTERYARPAVLHRASWDREALAHAAVATGLTEDTVGRVLRAAAAVYADGDAGGRRR